MVAHCVRAPHTAIARLAGARAVQACPVPMAVANASCEAAVDAGPALVALAASSRWRCGELAVIFDRI